MDNYLEYSYIKRDNKHGYFQDYASSYPIFYDPVVVQSFIIILLC